MQTFATPTHGAPCQNSFALTFTDDGFRMNPDACINKDLRSLGRNDWLIQDNCRDFLGYRCSGVCSCNQRGIALVTAASAGSGHIISQASDQCRADTCSRAINQKSRVGLPLVPSGKLGSEPLPRGSGRRANWRHPDWQSRPPAVPGWDTSRPALQQPTVPRRPGSLILAFYFRFFA
jgi:hypothetical protein